MRLKRLSLSHDILPKLFPNIFKSLLPFSELIRCVVKVISEGNELFVKVFEILLNFIDIWKHIIHVMDLLIEISEICFLSLV